MSHSEHTDLSGLMDACGNNPEVAVSLIRLYFELTGGELARLQAAVQKNDPATAAAVAHKCAGSSIACGIPGLAALFKALETDSAQGLPADAAQRLEDIRAGMSSARTELEAHFNISLAS